MRHVKGMKICQMAGRSRRKQTSKWEREGELLLCVCLRYILCTGLAGLPPRYYARDRCPHVIMMNTNLRMCKAFRYAVQRGSKTALRATKKQRSKSRKLTLCCKIVAGALPVQGRRAAPPPIGHCVLLAALLDYKAGPPASHCWFQISSSNVDKPQAYLA